MMNKLILAIVYPAILCTSILLTACAPQPRQEPQSPLELQAQTLQAEGDYMAAAELWREIAATKPEASAFLIRAADNWRLAQNWDAVADSLAAVDIQQLTAKQRAEFLILSAESALHQHQYGLAQQALSQITNTPASLQKRFQAINEELLARSQGPAATSLHNLMLTTSSPTPDSDAILEHFVHLASGNEQDLESLRQLRTDSAELAWIDLALIARTTLFKREPTGTLMRTWWDQYFAAGPNPEVATRAVSAFHRSFQYPQKVAVLLPLQTNLRSAASAIRDGMLSAWASLPQNQRPQLSFFALDDSEESAVGALLEAHEQGFDWIVGPLRRETVNSVLQFPSSTLPMLVLNRADEHIQPPPGLPVFSFALRPEDEATASAQLAINQGHQRALVLHSQDSWGQRVADAFSAEFSAAGGEVLHAQAFNPVESNHSPQLRSALGLNEADARYRRIRSLLGLPVGFNPVPRQDIDMIFLGARVTQARQLRPQLKFFDAGNIPIFATTQVYSGRYDPRNDRDLDDVQFPTSPWLLDQGQHQPSRQESEQWFESLDNAASARFFALGIDVIQLLPYLSYLQGDPNSSIAGAHGELSIDEKGFIHRGLSPVRFNDGRATLVIEPMVDPATEQNDGEPEGA